MERVSEALNTIVDPCSITAGVPGGLVDMGLVRDLRIDELPDGGHRVTLAVGVTEPTCVLLGSFIAEAQIRLRALDGVTAVDVRPAVFDWSEEDMDHDYMKRLNRHRQQERSRRALPIVGVRE